MTDLSLARRENFKEDCLAWAALHHFLPSDLLRELSSAIVDVASAGKLSIDGLFEQECTGSHQDVGCWVLKPLEVTAPLDQYLQDRIRAFSLANDGDVGYDPKVKGHGEIGPSAIESAVRFGRFDLESGTLARDNSELGQSSFRSFYAAFTDLCSSYRIAGTKNVDTIVAGPCAKISMPLSAVVMKHLGDLCADVDDWGKAHSFYEHASSTLSAFSDVAWTEFVKLLQGIVLQSRAAALRIMTGPAASASLLMAHLGRAKLGDQALFQLNASHDAMVSTVLSVKKFAFGPDLRASISMAPLLLRTHNCASALEASIEEKFSDAHSQFWRVLRRQTALGSASESRVTKALYARSIFAHLAQSVEKHNHLEAFSTAFRLILESGQVGIAKQLAWTEKVARAYLSDKTIDNVVDHTERNAGSTVERRGVLIELFAGWTRALAPDQSNLATRMQDILSDTARSDAPGVVGQERIALRSLELLNQLADARPEFRIKTATVVVSTVTETLSKDRYWTSYAEALKLASAYLDVLSQPLLNQVVESVLTFLDKLDPASGLWVIVQPALDLLTSTETKRLSVEDPGMEGRIFSTVLRFGINQETEHARLLFYLQDFDLKTPDPSMQAQLKGVVDDVRKKAKEVNASNAVANIQALLVAPTIVGRDGVKDAIDALITILKTAVGLRPCLSFAYAYSALLLISSRQSKIAEGIEISVDEFQSWLKEVLELLPKIWAKSREKPLIFAQFSLPEATTPDQVIIHNWAYASINFAIAMDNLPLVLAALESASTSPLLRGPILTARATRLAAEKLEKFDAKEILSEDRNTFYSALGQRLALLRKMPAEARAEIIRSLLHQCFRLGPRGLDLAVILSAIEMGVTDFETSLEYQSYLKRLDNDRDLRLAIYPALLDV